MRAIANCIVIKIHTSRGDRTFRNSECLSFLDFGDRKKLTLKEKM